MSAVVVTASKPPEDYLSSSNGHGDLGTWGGVSSEYP